MNVLPAYITVREASLALRVNHMTIYRMVNSEEIYAVRIGRIFRIPTGPFLEKYPDAAVYFDPPPD